MKLIIKGELTDFNRYDNASRRNKFAAAKIKKEETELVAWEAKAQRIPAVAEYPIQITYVWYSKDERKDVDNVAFAKKFINDGLVMAGVLKDDSRKYINGFEDRFEVDEKNPRIEIFIC